MELIGGANSLILHRRIQIKLAFRICKEAFVKLSSAYLCLLKNRNSVFPLTTFKFKDFICDAVRDV